MRINKYLAQKGIASRRKIDELIAGGKVTLNGAKAELGSNLVAGDLVEVLGQRYKFSEKTEEKILIAFNKPTGVVCTNDPLEKNNLPNYIMKHPDKFIGKEARYALILKSRLFSIGRLDKESRGLILLTNDGDLSQKLTHPKYEKEKEYMVHCEKEIDAEFIKKFCNRVEIFLPDDEKVVLTKKCQAYKVSKMTFSCVLKQGYKRQIRLMVRALGNKVTDLQRIRIAGLGLQGLKESYYKEIKPTLLDAS